MVFTVIKEKRYYIMIKRSIQQENITFVNIEYAANVGAPKYVKQILTDLKGEIRQQYSNGKVLQYPTFNNG